ncbi:PhnE/PtxC family ABC transporter permease [Cereibacter sphaeroides]|uniref:PhnE/PtxC family ABC transporter permease n=1 Tax=Cereibacter sphaeroides TaxID=1063 RepID=UPI001F287610|nr:ABC transporter permease [Cereibacter sphaeroides]
MPADTRHDPRRASRSRVLALFGMLTLAALLLADLRILGPDPGRMLAAMAEGLLHPRVTDLAALAEAAGLTVAFALCGVGLGAGSGLLLAPFYRLWPVRAACIAVRSIHELFWALLLMQVTGLSPLTGILAIGLPYAGIFAKVFAEYLDEADPAADRALPPATRPLVRLLYARLPLVLRDMANYTLYRIECGLRSAAVLGFIGLPTLGFLLESQFRQALYAEAAAVLGVYLALILPLRRWMRWPLVPLYLAASVWLLRGVEVPPMGSGVIWRFLTEDIVPAPLRQGDWAALPGWLGRIVEGQMLPGIWTTLVLSQVALGLTAVVAVICFPLIVPRVTGRIGAMLGHGMLVLGRTVPDYMLAFILLQILGPSMLPAVLALGLHNGAIVAHLLGRQSEGICATLRPDAPRGLTLWGYELLPRLFANILALLLYRWEIIVRDSAIFGLIGVATLGFHVDAAIQELRIDRALVLLSGMVALTLVIDAISRRLRHRLRLTATPGVSRAVLPESLGADCIGAVR